MTSKVALVDIGGVLVRVDVIRVTLGLAERAGCDPGDAEAALFQQDRKGRLDRGELEPNAWAAEVLAAAGLRAEAEEIAWLQRLWCDIFTAHPGATSLIAALRSAKVRVVLASNTDPMHFDRLEREFPDVAGADDAVLSFRIGATKPDAAFYRAALDRIAVPAAQALFVDDKSANVAAAKRLGIRALRVPPGYGRRWCQRELAAALSR